MIYYTIKNKDGIWQKISGVNSAGQCVMRRKGGECVRVCDEKDLVVISLEEVLKG